jgi:hypothetical protein
MTPNKKIKEEEKLPENTVAPKCPYCNGSGRNLALTIHEFTKKKKILSIPCVCFTSTTVSAEYKLLKHLGGQYMHPDKLSPELSVDFDDPSNSENLLLTGNYDALILSVKALIMKYRFDPRSPRILFSRSIDIIHDFHVPQDDGIAPHLSSTSSYALAIVIFGTIEKNQALAPCMAQLVQNRLEERKPLWIYFPETMPALTPSNQEYSPEVAVLLDKYFKRLTVSSNMKIEKGPSTSKKSVTRF